MHKVTIIASELAIITGHNKYENIQKAIDSVLNRSKIVKKYIPKSKIEIPNNGDVSKIAGTRPISDLIKAVITSEVKISPILIGAMKRLVKFLLQISSKKSILKPILVLNKKS